MFGEQVQNSAKRADCFMAATNARAIHCNNNSGIFKTVNSTHFQLIAKYTKYTKPHTVALNCNNNSQ